MKFELDAAQLAKYQKWREEQEKLALETQRAEMEARHKNQDYTEEFQDSIIESGYPYYGAIGGAVTFSFTPTSIGDIVTATHGFTKNKIDLTGDL